jgi:K+/H+ antiporter YhaU regulatory subunit KhtT
LIEADLRRRTGATLVAFTRESATAVHPSPDDVLQAGDILTLVGNEQQLAGARALVASGPDTAS